MKRGLSSAMRRMGLGTLLGLMICTMLVGHGRAQGGGYERTFKESKATIEKVLKDMQPAMSGRLPVLDGFALAGDHPLDRYQRGYFQAAVEVSAAPSGGSVVRVRAKVTAWFSDTIPSRSGYERQSRSHRNASSCASSGNRGFCHTATRKANRVGEDAAT